MSLEKVKEYFKAYGIEDRIIELSESSATVEPVSYTHLQLKVGDKVLMSKYSGTEVKVDGEEYTILREEDILAVVE